MMKKWVGIKSVIVIMTGLLTFSCIDQSYDLSTVSKKLELFGNSMAIPIGNTTIYMDSIIGNLDLDTSVLQIKNGTYIFKYAGSIDLSGLTNSIGDFSMATVNGFSSTIDLYDARNAPSVPFDLPPTVYQYSGNTQMDLPNFSTSLITIDSVDLTQTTLRIILSNVGLGGPKLRDNISITYTVLGNAADYYQNGLKKHTWTVHMGDTCDLELRKLRLNSHSNSLTLQQTVNINVEQLGDIQATEPIVTKMIYTMELINGIDYDVVYGKVDYSLDAATADPINFDALGSILGDNDVLSFYDPTIELSTTGNIGVPIDLTFNLGTSNSKTDEARSLTGNTFHILPASSPAITKVNTFKLDKTNGTADLFKINPDQITMGYSVQTDKNTTYNHFIAKNTQLSMNYKMEIPLQFGGDLHLNMGQTIDSPVGDLTNLDQQDGSVIGLSLNVQNRLPMALQLKLTALDKDSMELFTTISDTIQAAVINVTTGKATAEKPTSTDLSLTSDQIALLPETKKFRVGFIVTTNSHYPFVTVQPSDYIKIAIGARIEGGLQFDLGKTDTSN